jgi:hypothetical protein
VISSTMSFEIALIAVVFGAAALFLWLSEKMGRGEEESHYRLFFFVLGLLFILFSLFMCLFLAYDNTEYVLTGTREASFYYNCTETVATCTGEPYADSCLQYNETQCADIAGCSWSQETCSGTPTWTCEELGAYGGQLKCSETDGCSWEVSFAEGTCDRIDVNYTQAEMHPYAGMDEPIIVLIYGMSMLIFFILMFFLLQLALDVFSRADKSRRDVSWRRNQR